MGLAAFSVEFCAAFFSVYGLSKLFSGAALSVIFMAGALEFAKVISSSYLYRYWKKISFIFKSYMVGAILTLMLITSIGIYGYLMNAFQNSTIDLEKINNKLIVYESTLKNLEEDKKSMKEDFDIQLKSFSDKFVGAKSKLRKDYMPRQDEINKKIFDTRDSIIVLKSKMVDTGSDVGPIIFVSRFFNIDISIVVQYLIFLFIIVFDPLAICLIISFNKVLLDNSEKDSENKINNIEKDLAMSEKISIFEKDKEMDKKEEIKVEEKKKVPFTMSNFSSFYK